MNVNVMRRLPRRRHSGPDEIAITDVLAALPEEPPTVTLLAADGEPSPRPTFTPREPGPVFRDSYAPVKAVTGLGPSGEAPYAGRHAASVPRHVQQPREVLEATLSGLRALPPSRAAAFRADKRELPLFRKVVRQQGLCGLHAPWRPRHVRWTTDQWMDGAMEAISADTSRARSEAGARLGQALARATARLDGYQRRESVSGD